MLKGKKLALLCLFFLMCFKAIGQNPIPMGPYIGQEPKRSMIRTFLSKFTLSISSGYGRTYYSHKLEGVGLIQKGADSLFIFDNVLNISNDTISAVYNGWLNDPIAFSEVVIDGDTISSNGIPVNIGDYLLDTDTAEVKLIGRGTSVPIELMLHFSFDRYRIGFGFTMEFHSLGSFRSKNFGDSINGFTPSFKRATFKRFFGMAGATVYQSGHFKAVADIHFGSINLGKNWNTAVLQKGIFMNLGINAEQDFSEYLTAFIRPSVELKSYTITVPETDIEVNHQFPAFFINAGIRLRLPRLRRCPIKKCATQINHVHWGTEYRSRMHPFYKWQNPNYGENYKKLIKFKGKNKKDLNPY